MPEVFLKFHWENIFFSAPIVTSRHPTRLGRSVLVIEMRALRKSAEADNVFFRKISILKKKVKKPNEISEIDF